MFELIAMTLLGIAYINALKDESDEEKRQQEREKCLDLKCKVFAYSVRKGRLYNEVVGDLKSGKLSMNEIEKCLHD